MSRVIPAYKQFIDGEGNPVPFGKLYFKEALSITTDKDTFADESETTANENPYILDGEGRAYNIWGTGAYYSYLETKDGTRVGEPENPIGEGASLIPFSQWSSLLNYQQYAKVQGSDGKYYESRVNNNLGNDPISDSGANWFEIRFMGAYNSNTDYAVGDITFTPDGNLWASQVTPNVGNDPSTDNGTNWLPAVSGVKIPEVITLETRTTTVIPQTGGGALTVLRVNELQDGDTGYTIPLANTVSANQTITITQPDEFVSFEPVATASGSDTITDSTGTDTSITFDNSQSVEIILTSDGTSDWRL